MGILQTQTQNLNGFVLILSQGHWALLSCWSHLQLKTLGDFLFLEHQWEKTEMGICISKINLSEMQGEFWEAGEDLASVC